MPRRLLGLEPDGYGGYVYHTMDPEVVHPTTTCGLRLAIPGRVPVQGGARDITCPDCLRDWLILYDRWLHRWRPNL